jgi:hypothetical protein
MSIIGTQIERIKQESFLHVNQSYLGVMIEEENETFFVILHREIGSEKHRNPIFMGSKEDCLITMNAIVILIGEGKRVITQKLLNDNLARYKREQEQLKSRTEG